MSPLRDRPELAGLDRFDLYAIAYMRTAHRIKQEISRNAGLNVERLQRRLQRIYDVMVEEIENDHAYEQTVNTVTCAIGRSITDHGLPATLRFPIPYPDALPRPPAAKEPLHSTQAQPEPATNAKIKQQRSNTSVQTSQQAKSPQTRTTTTRLSGSTTR